MTLNGFVRNSFTSANGVEVYLHPEGHPHRDIMPYLGEAISKVVIPENATFYKETVACDEQVGFDHLVETGDDAEILYWNRGRAGDSRMVLNYLAPRTNKVTLILCVATDPEEFAGKWVVVTAFPGEQGMPEPWDRKCESNPALKAQSEAFWQCHALVPTEYEWEQLRDAGLA